MKDLSDNFIDKIYLAIELECENCHRQFNEGANKIEEHTETKIREWAKKIATSAHRSGWQMLGSKIICPACAVNLPNCH